MMGHLDVAPNCTPGSVAARAAEITCANDLFADIINHIADMMVQMDDLDTKLVTALLENARMPVATLAKRLGVARSTVQARLERLELSGAIEGYTLRLGQAARAPRVRATVLLQIEPRAMAQVLSRLKTRPEVSQATTTTGRFDLILSLATGSTEELDRSLDEIGMIPGVRSSESLVHLSTKIDRPV